MASQGQQPKVILFDIGGVCVVSPFQSILDYELKMGIPPGWVNHSISKTSPGGFWHRLEEGKIPVDATFFAGFNRDLRDAERWAAFYQARRASDPRLPADTPPVPEVDGERLFGDMMAAAQMPDPWMFPALQRLRASGRYVLAALSNTVIFPPGHEYARGDFFADDPVRRLFDVFVSSAHVGLRKPDPRIYRLALERVDGFARRNAHTGRGRAGGWAEGVRPDDVLFLDDIGENLKAARRAGFRTIRVPLGMAFEAVAELEKATGLELAGDHPEVPARLSGSIGRPLPGSIGRAKI